MPAHSSKRTEAKNHILKIAADFLCKHGLHSTRPEQIIEATGSRKGQFYHYFKSKDGLLHEVLQWHLASIRNGTSQIHSDIRSWDDVEAWFRSQVELQKSFGMKRSCIFGTTANEVTESNHLIREDVRMIFDDFKLRLATFFREEKRQSRMSADTNEDALADFCIAAIQGAMLIGKLQRDSRYVDSVVRQALIHVQRFIIA